MSPCSFPPLPLSYRAGASSLPKLRNSAARCCSLFYFGFAGADTPGSRGRAVLCPAPACTAAPPQPRLQGRLCSRRRGLGSAGPCAGKRGARAADEPSRGTQVPLIAGYGCSHLLSLTGDFSFTHQPLCFRGAGSCAFSNLLTKKIRGWRGSWR